MILKYKLSLTSNKANVVLMLLMRGVSMVISFLYVPLLLNTLETDSYAIWLTLTSVVSWIVMFDIGLGNGLRNKLSEAIALNDNNAAQTYVSTAYLLISGIGILLVGLLACSIPFTNWTEILNAKNIARIEINELVLIVGACFIIHFILGLLNSILLALKMPAISSLIGCVGQILSYLTVLLAVKYFHIIDLIPLCTIISSIPVLILLISTIIFYNGRYKFLLPKISYFNIHKSKDLFRLGVKFFWIQIITIVLFQANNFIIIHTINPTAVVEYNICYKYFYTLVTVYVLICTPFWSASTHAYTIGDYTWIKNVNQRLLKIGMLFGILGFIMVCTANQVYLFWVGKECPTIPFSSNVWMLMYCLFMIAYSANGYIINGIGKLRLQMIVTSILAIIYIPMAFFGGKYMGLNGVLVALSFNAFVNACWSTIQLQKFINQTATGIWNN